MLLKCWQNHIVDIRTAAFSRGQEKAGINHIGKIKSLGLTQQINFKFTRVSCFPWVWASYMAFDLTKFWSLLILVSVNENSNCKWHLCARPCLSSLKNKFQWTQNNVWPLIRKILIWTFWDYKSSWSKKSTPIQPRGVIGAPLLCIFKRCNSWECSVHFFRGPCVST